jgi:hypothetical protein
MLFDACIKEHENHASERVFFPKFLTFKNLFELELSDPSFCQQICSQFLIIFYFLQAQTKKEQDKLTQFIEKTKGQVTISRFVNYNFVLSEEEENWLLKSKAQCLVLLERLGKSFLKSIQLVLAHEYQWVRWKLESCPSFEKLPIEIDAKIPRNLQVRSLFCLLFYIKKTRGVTCNSKNIFGHRANVLVMGSR